MALTPVEFTVSGYQIIAPDLWACTKFHLEASKAIEEFETNTGKTWPEAKEEQYFMVSASGSVKAYVDGDKI